MSEPSLSPALEFLSQFISSMAGAGFGAWLAFKFADKHRQVDEEQRQSKAKAEFEEKKNAQLLTEYEKIAALFFVFYSRLSALHNFIRKFVRDGTEELDPEFEIQIIYQHVPIDPLFIKDLTPLIRAKKTESISRLVVSDAQYFSWVDALTERNKDARKLIEILQQKGLRSHEPLGRELASLAESDMVGIQNMNLTAAAIKANERISASLDELSTLISELYPQFPSLRAQRVEKGKEF